MSNGIPYAVTFRSGKVVIREMGEQTGEGQCFTGNGKIILRLDGEDHDMEIEINDDGTPQTPLGEMKKHAR